MFCFAFARAKAVFFQNPDDEALFLRERTMGCMLCVTFKRASAGANGKMRRRRIVR